jgi:hypothetical protein
MTEWTDERHEAVKQHPEYASKGTVLDMLSEIERLRAVILSAGETIRRLSCPVDEPPFEDLIPEEYDHKYR